MNNLEIEIKVREIILEQAGAAGALSADVSQLSLGDSLFEGKLGMDSLDFVDLGIALEDEFGIDLDDEALEKFKTVGDVVRWVQERKAAA